MVGGGFAALASACPIFAPLPLDPSPSFFSCPRSRRPPPANPAADMPPSSLEVEHAPEQVERAKAARRDRVLEAGDRQQAEERRQHLERVLVAALHAVERVAVGLVGACVLGGVFGCVWRESVCGRVGAGGAC